MYKRGQKNLREGGPKGGGSHFGMENRIGSKTVELSKEITADTQGGGTKFFVIRKTKEKPATKMRDQ